MLTTTAPRCLLLDCSLSNLVKMARNTELTVTLSRQGGAWMLLLAYHHNGGENMDLVENAIPISPTDGYSHAFLNQFKDASGNNAFSAKAVRFYCESSNEHLSMHSLESHLNSRTIELPGHAIPIPNAKYLEKSKSDKITSTTTKTTNSNKDFINYVYHWSIREQGSKWECNSNNNDYSQSTLHQIWINVNNINTNNVNTNNIKTNVKVKGNQLNSKKTKINSEAVT
eukprot:gene14475-30813_t